MPTEIERKFLVVGTDWKQGAVSAELSQGYLSQDPERTVRIRITEDRAFLTIKGFTEGISRQEFEYPVPLNDAEQILALCLPSIITKTRYTIEAKGRRWEVDEFHGDNKGLVIAEIELDHESDAIEKPAWVGTEVSADPRYYNASLAQLPYCQWREKSAW